MESKMDPQAELGIVRAAYAKQVLAAAGVDNGPLAQAFAAIPREDFVGPGPWLVLRWLRDYVPTPDDDPVYLYTDDLVALVPERRVNNGQPSLHAHLIHQALPAAGDHVVHVGTGTGYYTAILAHLVGPSGRVTGIEYDGSLAARAKANLASYSNVTVVEGDGTQVPFDPADVIYVNAGCTRPAERWLDGLADGGRLILPMTSDEGIGGITPARMASAGAVFRIERKATNCLARWISPVAIFPCAGGRDEASERALAEAFTRGGWEKVTRLYRGEDIPDERCWLRGPGWCLAYH
jgi:protein-L-isoaspartate(D-aspartate) O-methyltransferase